MPEKTNNPLDKNVQNYYNIRVSAAAIPYACLYHKRIHVACHDTEVESLVMIKERKPNEN